MVVCTCVICLGALDGMFGIITMCRVGWGDTTGNFQYARGTILFWLGMIGAQILLAVKP